MELYIHIPFCMKKCDYCDFLSYPWPADIRKDYTVALCREIEFFGNKLVHPTIETIFIGGGTPTWLEANRMSEIMETVRACFKISEDAEISMECNPGTASIGAFASYRSWGLNRLSIGLQSANDDELLLLGRPHDFNRFLKTFENARRSGIYNINIDIMTGLPRQTKKKLMNTLEAVVSLRPEHISAYSLMIEEGTPFYDRYHFDDSRRKEGLSTTNLPDEEESYYLQKMTEGFLEEKGYKRYEISNFARDGLRCRHNEGYWTRKPYLGVGLGAASLIGNTRTSNERDLDSYLAHCSSLNPDGSGDSPMWERVDALSRKEEIEEFMFLGLRMVDGISRKDFFNCFGTPIESFYRNVLESLKSQGFLLMEGGRIRLSEIGMDVSNRILARFLLSE